MTHWTDVPQSLGACEGALEYATFEEFWRDCANPHWLLWAVEHGLIAMPFDPALATAGDVCTTTVTAAWDVYTATMKAARDARDDATEAARDVYDAAAKTALDVYAAAVTAAGRCYAERIRAAAEPFTLGPAWSQEGIHKQSGGVE